MVESTYNIQKIEKAGSRGRKGVMLGYSPRNSNAYQILDWESGKVVESRNAKFIEDKLPLAEGDPPFCIEFEEEAYMDEDEHDTDVPHVHDQMDYASSDDEDDQMDYASSDDEEVFDEEDFDEEDLNDEEQHPTDHEDDDFGTMNDDMANNKISGGADVEDNGISGGDGPIVGESRSNSDADMNANQSPPYHLRKKQRDHQAETTLDGLEAWWTQNDIINTSINMTSVETRRTRPLWKIQKKGKYGKIPWKWNGIS